ncbi:hypothetical protein ABZ611_22955 [Streptomyces sp. NPDC007861]|uniref:hypothetical protein n=1 Tax=Streptomyces sp. NPDC007861 TaxID=3154893 RepID=UPI0033E0A11C
MPDREQQDPQVPRDRRAAGATRPEGTVQTEQTEQTEHTEHTEQRGPADQEREIDTERRRRRAQFLRELNEAKALRERVQPRRARAARMRQIMRMRSFRW